MAAKGGSDPAGEEASVILPPFPQPASGAVMGRAAMACQQQPGRARRAPAAGSPAREIDGCAKGRPGGEPRAAEGSGTTPLAEASGRPGRAGPACTDYPPFAPFFGLGAYVRSPDPARRPPTPLFCF
jgi:hypothetical protein